MFCPECGKKVKDDAGFCTGCGKKLPSLAKADKPEVKERAAAPAATPKPANRVILFILVGLILVGLSIGGFLYWQKTKGTGEDNFGSAQTSNGDQSSQSPTTKTTLAEPLIKESATKLVLTQTDVGSKLKFDDGENSLDDIKKSFPEIATELTEAYGVNFDNEDNEGNLANTALKYTSVEAAKTSYQYIKTNLYKLVYQWGDTGNAKIEILSSENFGNESEIKKLTVPEGDYTTVFTCVFRFGNIIEMLWPLDQAIAKEDLYSFSKILEDKINQAAHQSSETTTVLPTSSPTLSTKEKTENAYDSIVKSNLTLLQIGLNHYFSTNGHYPANLQLLLEENIVKKIPVDPRTKEPYEYQTDGKGFTLIGTLGDGSTYKVSN